VGETFRGFRLLAELGRGGQGSVFLATQPALANRPVVLKLTARDGGEHLSLARLQHTHIVPLLFAEDDAAQNTRVLCMPYFGNATLKHIGDGLKDMPVARRAGLHLLEIVDRMQAEMPVALPTQGPARQVLSRVSFVQAICWIGTCLAEALQYAHERGLVHLDIKPSNVLLAVDGHPMLLDFHLAQEPIDPAAAPPEWLGGSPSYMSPEHKAAAAAIRKNQPVAAAVDEQSDIYSLGALLYEALGGTLPYRPGISPPLYRCNAVVSVGLADIICKCLAAEPSARYSSAGDLAADLKRHLTNQPLHGVANRSVLERWRKWRRRRPYTLPLSGLLLGVLIAAGAVALNRQANVGHQRRQLETIVQAGRDHLQAGRIDEAVSGLRHGLVLAEETPQNMDLAQEITALLQRAEGGQAARELHGLAEQIRFLYGADSLPVQAMAGLEARCWLLWTNRERILNQLGLAPGATTGVEQARTDLLDLAIFWTDLRVRLAPPSAVADVRREALQTLDQAEALFGPSAILNHERRSHAQAVGELSFERPTTSFPPRTAWEHYALGRSFLQAGDHARAARQFQDALAIDPHGFWPNFYFGISAYRLEQYLNAVTAFSVCIGSVPDNARCFYNRGLCFSALEHPDEAVRDYDRAVSLDPALAPAFLNRGLLHFRANRPGQAVTDLKQALDLGANPATVHYNLALVYLASADQPRALESLRQALASDPAHKEARQTLDNLTRQPRRSK
jgi:serine/threonine protein kinase/Tfp pilus assembly protein PilF